MRCSQPYGLTPEALMFLSQNARKIDHCSHCGRYDDHPKTEIGTYGMQDELGLYRHTLSDGRTADEYVQHEVWSSGPMIWLGLQCGDVKFEWEEEDMEY